jgi:hypothetical protein
MRLDRRDIALIAAAITDPTPRRAALLDAEGAGRLLNVPASWLLAEARAERVPHIRLSRYVRFDADELSAWAAARLRGPRGRGIDARRASDGVQAYEQ